MIYLDNAATTFPKPYEVVEGVRRFMTNCGGNAGRGSHPNALVASKTVYDCREELARFFDAEDAGRVCFTLNTTHALNLCIKGMLKKGDHVLISDLEHNAVLRPIHKLAVNGEISYDVFPSMVGDPKRNAMRICAGIAKRLKKETKMVVCTGASNICSVPMPLEEIGAFCHRHGILFVVDGAQSAGHIDMSMKKMNIDALCVPSHKGLLGPQGCGAVIFGKGIEADTILEGGNGVDSLELLMSSESPERYEAGTLPTPAIAGLCEGVRIVGRLGSERITKHEKELFYFLSGELCKMRKVRVYYPEYAGPVLTFGVEGFLSEEVARRLSDAGICTRGGYHCAYLGHKTLGTLSGGSVRVSFGVYNNAHDVECLCREVREMVR